MPVQFNHNLLARYLLTSHLPSHTKQAHQGILLPLLQQLSLLPLASTAAVLPPSHPRCNCVHCLLLQHLLFPHP